MTNRTIVRARRWRVLVLGALALVCGAQAAHAQDSPSADADLTPEEDRVAVESFGIKDLLDLGSSVATKQEQQIGRTPAIVSVVTDEQVRDYGWLTINDVLAQLPGFAPGQEFERRVLTFRGNPDGWNSNRLLLLVDGAPFNDVEVDGAYTWEATSLAFFKKVDVLRGPASAVYGTNALHGVVGLETLSVEDLGGAGVRAVAKLAFDATTMSVVGGQRTSLVDVVAGAASYNRDPDPYSDYDGSLRTTPDGDLARFPVHDSRRHYHLMTKLDGRQFLSGLSFALHLQDGNFQTGHGWYEHIPDDNDSYNENRIVPSLRYRHATGPLSFDHVVQFQRQSYDFNIRFYENGAEGGDYPDGVTEQLATDMERVFARSQVTLDLGSKANVLAGAEYAATLYDGDEMHEANADLGDTDAPFDEQRAVGPMYQPIVDRPVHRLAGFAQLVTGEWLTDRVELTAGLRYDGLLYEYVPVAMPDGLAVGDSFHEVSPRIGLVARPIDWLALKAMASRAFRTPSIIELFASNTWTAGSNPETLRPERDTTYELAAAVQPLDWLRWRSNGFYSRRDDHISYADGVSDILLNLYSNERVGAESEVLAALDVGASRIEGRTSVSYVALVDEHSHHPDVAAGEELANAPELMVKAGARWMGSKTTLSAEVYAQGATRRRDSSMVTPEFREVRPDEVPAYLSMDAAAFYRIAGGLRLGLTASNLFDKRQRIIAPFDSGFDFRVDPRRVFLTLELVQ
jgi:outer membrane receptor protein involved in Fe transport